MAAESLFQACFEMFYMHNSVSDFSSSIMHERCLFMLLRFRKICAVWIRWSRSNRLLRAWQWVRQRKFSSV